MSVLIADLVLLQTIWRVFKLAIDRALVTRLPKMRFCEGCQLSGPNLPQKVESPLRSQMREETRKNGVYVAVSNNAEENLEPGAFEGR